MNRCNEFVSWWDGEYEGNCEMPEGHRPSNLHYDGMSYFDDDGDEVREEDIPVEIRWRWSRILAALR